MGHDCFEAFPDLVREADDILGYSIVDLCLENPDEKLGQTQFTQPALFTVNALMYLQRLQAASDIPPDLAAGHSLGEYNALFSAGVFDFATGLRLVQRRGEIMSRVEGGGMAAVIGLAPDEIDGVLKDAGFSDIDIANLNSPKQTVISGSKPDIEAAQAAFEAAGARMYVVLKVSGAFHSRYMAESAAEFADYLADIDFMPPQFPVIANYSAQPYDNAAVRDHLVKQIDNSVRWTDTIEYLLDQADPQIEEIGPGKVLSSLVRQIQRGR